MAEAPKLRVITGDGEIALGDVVPDDYALLEEANRKLRREVAAYKSQLSRLRKVDPQAEVIERLLVTWRNTLRGPTSRVEIPVDGKRAEAVRRTLRRLIENDEDPELAHPDKAKHAEAVENATQRAEARIMEAIEGLARFPFEGAYGRRFAEAGPGLKRKDEILYALRDEVKMEQFVNLSHEAEDRHAAYRVDLWRRLQDQPNLRLVLASLGPVPQGEVLARAIRWACANP